MSGDETVIVMRSASFGGSETDARDILLTEIIRMHPLSPTASDIALARLQRAVRKVIHDVRLSLTTMDELTRLPLLSSDVCFLIRTPERAQHRVAGSFA